MLVWSAGAAFAVDPNRAMSQYIRERWGIEQGFPRGPVYSLAQSADGYLWIGTDAGVTRYDGITWSSMDSRDGLASDLIDYIETLDG